MRRTALTAMLLWIAAMLSATVQAQSEPALSVPLMLPASDTVRQSFVRLVNRSNAAGAVRIVAVDDGGYIAAPITISLAANSALHFNSSDITDGNARKGIDEGIGSPRTGNWRLHMETALSDVQVLSYIRTSDGFLTAMHDVLPRDSEGRLVARTVNPANNRDQRSSLRLVNTGTNLEQVSIAGLDDAGNDAGPVTLSLAPRQSRTLSVVELEEGAPDASGTLGDGTGKWELRITASQAVLAMSLLETPSGSITNLSTIGFPVTGSGGNAGGAAISGAIDLDLYSSQDGSIEAAGDKDHYRLRVTESGTLTVYTTGTTDTYGRLYDEVGTQIATDDDSGLGNNFRIQREVPKGTHFVSVEGFDGTATGTYTISVDFRGVGGSGFYYSYAVGEPRIQVLSYSDSYGFRHYAPFLAHGQSGYGADDRTETVFRSQAEADQAALDFCYEPSNYTYGLQSPRGGRLETEVTDCTIVARWDPAVQCLVGAFGFKTSGDFDQDTAVEERIRMVEQSELFHTFEVVPRDRDTIHRLNEHRTGCAKRANVMDENWCSPIASPDFDESGPGDTRHSCGP